MRMLVMPTDVHPTLDPPNKALVEPAASGIYFWITSGCLTA